jgi:hypothetical protein
VQKEIWEDLGPVFQGGLAGADHFSYLLVRTWADLGIPGTVSWDLKLNEVETTSQLSGSLRLKKRSEQAQQCKFWKLVFPVNPNNPNRLLTSSILAWESTIHFYTISTWMSARPGGSRRSHSLQGQKRLEKTPSSILAADPMVIQVIRVLCQQLGVKCKRENNELYWIILYIRL